MSLDRATAKLRSSLICEGSTRYKYYLILLEGCYHGLAQIVFELVSLQFEHMLLQFSGLQIEEAIINSIHTLPTLSYWFLYFKKTYLKIGKNKISLTYQCKYNQKEGGLVSFKDGKQQFLYTYFQPYFANRVFPCFDQPDIKAKMKLAIIAPQKWKIISNQAANPAQVFSRSKCINSKRIQPNTVCLMSKFAQKVGKNMAITTFPKTKLLPTYLFCFYAGNFCSVITTQISKVPMTIYCTPSVMPKLKRCSEFIFSVTIQCMTLFARKFNMPFPFKKYDQTFIPISIQELKNSAIENAGNVLYDEFYLIPQNNTNFNYFDLALVLAHELAHHWFGNCVTMKWWNDLFLSESFAEYMSYVAIGKLNRILPYPTQQSSIFLRDRITNGYVKDQTYSTHPIITQIKDTNDVQSIFNGITYQKGAMCIRQMNYLMGKKQSYKAISQYLYDFKWLNTNLRCLMSEIRLISNSIDNDWEKSWLKTSSVSYIKCKWDFNNSRIKIKQKNFDGRKLFRHHIINVSFFNSDGSFDIVQKAVIDSKKRSLVSYPKSQHPYKAVFLNYQSCSFIENVIDKVSLTFFKSNISKITNLEVRGEILYNMQSMAFLKLIQISEYVDFLVLLIKNQEHPFILSRLLNNIRNIDPIQFRKSEGINFMFKIYKQIVDQLNIHKSSSQRYFMLLQFVENQQVHLDKNSSLLWNSLQSFSKRQCQAIYKEMKKFLNVY